MKFNKEQTYLVYAIAIIIALSFITVQAGFGDLIKASVEGEQTEVDVWTNLNVEYRYSIDAPIAFVTVDFHNNKMFETSDEFGDDVYHATYNFTSFDFRLRSVEETDAYPVGIRSFSEDGVELPRGESYNVDIRVRDTLIEGEPIKVEITAMGYEEDGRRSELEEKVSLTLQSPVYGELEEETPGFTFTFAAVLILFTSYIISKKR